MALLTFYGLISVLILWVAFKLDKADRARIAATQPPIMQDSEQKTSWDERVKFAVEYVSCRGRGLGLLWLALFGSRRACWLISGPDWFWRITFGSDVAAPGGRSHAGPSRYCGHLYRQLHPDATANAIRTTDASPQSIVSERRGSDTAETYRVRLFTGTLFPRGQLGANVPAGVG